MTADTDQDCNKKFIQHSNSIQVALELHSGQKAKKALIKGMCSFDSKHIWLVKTLMNINNRLHDEFEIASITSQKISRNNTFQMAWHTRNLMELSILCQNIREDFQLLKLLYKNWLADDINTIIHTQNDEINMQELDEPLFDIDVLANNMEMLSEYKESYILQSKLVQPSAFSLLAGEKEIVGIQERLYDQGAAFFIQAHTALESAIYKHFPRVE